MFIKNIGHHVAKLNCREEQRVILEIVGSHKQINFTQNFLASAKFCDNCKKNFESKGVSIFARMQAKVPDIVTFE